MMTPAWSYKKKVLWLIVAIGIFRLVLAFIVELSMDECYYWLYSQHLKSNYFDHPPMIALWIRATTINLSLQDYAGFIRLGSVISCCIATWFIYKCVSTLSNERAGFYAACLYNAFFYVGVTAGIFADPDAPQMLFFSWSLYLIVLITKDENNWKYWLLFGVVNGLCIMSKVHGVFLWIGIVCYALFYKLKWLGAIKFYTAVFISITICLPILLWNIHYDFLTFKFNGPRVAITDRAIIWHNFFHEIGAQVIKNNPLNFLIILFSLISLKKHFIQPQPALTIFNLCGIPLALILLIVSLHSHTLTHWCGPAYVALVPLASIYLEKKSKSKFFSSLAGLSVGAHMFALILIVLFINFFPGTCGVASGSDIGSNDNSLDFYGWRKAGQIFDSIYITYQQKNLIPKNTTVITYTWLDAHVEYYFCEPIGIKMIGLGNIMDLHEYEWLNNERKDSVNMQQAFCVVPSIVFYDVKKTYRDYYNHVDSVTTLPVFRSGKLAYNFYVYRLYGWKGKIPVKN